MVCSAIYIPVTLSMVWVACQSVWFYHELTFNNPRVYAICNGGGAAVDGRVGPLFFSVKDSDRLVLEHKKRHNLRENNNGGRSKLK